MSIFHFKPSAGRDIQVKEGFKTLKLVYKPTNKKNNSIPFTFFSQTSHVVKLLWASEPDFKYDHFETLGTGHRNRAQDD